VGAGAIVGTPRREGSMGRHIKKKMKNFFTQMYTTPRKRTFPVAYAPTPRKSVRVATVPAATLNSRIHRILNRATELKVFTNNSGIAVTNNAVAWKYYINPLVGIVQGVGSNQRIGDKIRIERISISSRWEGVYTNANFVGDLSLCTRNCILTRNDPTLVATSLTNFAASDFIYGGFLSFDELNTHDYKVLYDKKSQYHPSPMSAGFGAMAGGFGYKDHHSFGVKYFPKGKIASFLQNTNVPATESMVCVFTGDIPGYLTAASHYNLYINVNVYYRDV